MNDFVYSLDDEDYYDFDEFILRVEDGYFEDDMVPFSRGLPSNYSHRDMLNIDSVFEQMQDQAYDLGGERAKEYLNDMTVESKKELEQLILEWFDAKCSQPCFYSVKNTRDFKVTRDELLSNKEDWELCK